MHYTDNQVRLLLFGAQIVFRTNFGGKIVIDFHQYLRDKKLS